MSSTEGDTAAEAADTRHAGKPSSYIASCDSITWVLTRLSRRTPSSFSILVSVVFIPTFPTPGKATRPKTYHKALLAKSCQIYLLHYPDRDRLRQYPLVTDLATTEGRQQRPPAELAAKG
jgi:hypothetical protein